MIVEIVDMSSCGSCQLKKNPEIQTFFLKSTFHCFKTEIPKRQVVGHLWHITRAAYV
jgi:hypothetical protein